MKKLITLVMMAVMSFGSLQTQAQAFDRSTKMLTLSIGGADMFHIPAGYAYYSSLYSPLTAQVYVQGEFAVHKYVGVGFNATIGGRPANYGYYGGAFGGGYYTGYRSEFNVAVGGLANFHFYQLIADKTGKNLHADKLDIYVGLSLGGGVAIHPSDAYYATNLDGLFYVGPQVGIHYFFNDRIGINGEVGFGKTFVSGGVTFKLGGSKGGSSKGSSKKK